METTSLMTKEGYLTEQAKINIIEIEKQAKEIDRKKKQLREALLQAMTEFGVKKIDTDDLLITVKESTYKEQFNSKKFKEENEEMYNAYIELTPVKESLLVKVR